MRSIHAGLMSHIKPDAQPYMRRSKKFHAQTVLTRTEAPVVPPARAELRVKPLTPPHALAHLARPECGSKV